MYTLILSAEADLWNISNTPMEQRLKNLDLMEKIFIKIMTHEGFECRVMRVTGKNTLMFDCQGPDALICVGIEQTLALYGHPDE